ncbi:hypothetical protein [Streptomyces albidoflavus]|nr:hypothetical protein [Streptomyces albidoflavus]
MVASQNALRGDHWDDWLASDCPALLVRGERSGTLSAEHVKKKNPVLYSAKLEYSNVTNAMPTGITLSAENAHGHIFKDVYIPNKPGKRDTC